MFKISCVLWRRRFGEFDSELGLASSPILYRGMVLLLCDHDGSARRTFDSFLVALDLHSGQVVWNTARPGLFRSWSTPLAVTTAEGSDELIVNAQDELRGYDPRTGAALWTVRGMTGWVTPSPVAGQGLVFAASGRDGPTVAVRPGGRGDVTADRVVWKVDRGSPYVCSPLLYGSELYVPNESGILRCYDASSGRQHYEQRLAGRFMASPVAGDGKLYLTNDEGTTFVVRAGKEFALLSTNTFNVAKSALSVRVKSTVPTSLFAVSS